MAKVGRTKRPSGSTGNLWSELFWPGLGLVLMLLSLCFGCSGGDGPDGPRQLVRVDAYLDDGGWNRVPCEVAGIVMRLGHEDLWPVSVEGTCSWELPRSWLPAAVLIEATQHPWRVAIRSRLNEVTPDEAVWGTSVRVFCDDRGEVCWPLIEGYR